MFVSNGIGGGGVGDCGGVMPIRLMTKQRKLVYDNKDRIGKVNAAKKLEISC